MRGLRSSSSGCRVCLVCVAPLPMLYRARSSEVGKLCVGCEVGGGGREVRAMGRERRKGGGREDGVWIASCACRSLIGNYRIALSTPASVHPRHAQPRSCGCSVIGARVRFNGLCSGQNGL
eukprot:1041404-Rhodomonas_salina.1